MSRERTRLHLAGALRPRSRKIALALPALLCLSLPAWDDPSADEPEDSCVACHSNANFFVTNRKLYDYFQKWSSSIHRQEEVSCADCHGGDADVPDKDGAHGRNLEASDRSSAVNFRNIPHTCGECHDEVYEGFRQSSHFQHVAVKKQEDQGPTCVTCHGSINVAVLNVNTVEEACSRCHNEQTDNHPDTPEEARSLLNRFLSIHRYYRYITVRGDPQETREFFEKIDAQIHDLSVTWHTFDLSQIREKTEAVLESVREKRKEVARIWKETRRKRQRRPGE